MDTGPRKPARSEELKNLAVLAVMSGGCLESSGRAKLAILREEGLMIAYRTPFNPLPEGALALRDDIPMHGPNLGSEPYAVDVWAEGTGKVLSMGWRDRGNVVTALYRTGTWEEVLAKIAQRARERGQIERSRLSTDAKAARLRAVRGTEKASAPKRRVRRLPDAALHLKRLERENAKLRELVAAIALDKLILGGAGEI